MSPKSLVGVLREEWNAGDSRDVVSQLNDLESLLRFKRRWLMDLPLTVRERKRLDEMLPPNDGVLPESLIREDDVSYEEIKTRIEMGFGAHKRGKELYCAQEDAQLYNSRDILFHLDYLTNKGLCSLTEILTGGILKFEKTNWRMSRTVKELLHKNDISKAKLKQVSLLLKDPKNFRGNYSACSIPSEVYRAAAVSVLEKLTVKDFPMIAILAMVRRLRNSKGFVPSLRQRQKSGPKRDTLIRRVTEVCMKKLSDLSEANNEPAGELSGALGVAGLTLKLILNHADVIDFRKFPPEIECLQNDIAKAIHLLKNQKKLGLIEMEKVRLHLDPEAKFSDNSLRRDVENMLTECLYECGDMDRVPDDLLETVNIINRSAEVQLCKNETSSRVLLSPHDLMKEAMRKEVEHVLIVSAYAKGVLLDLLPHYAFDEDFAHAYMEDFDEEEVWDTYEHYEVDSCGSYDLTESMGQNDMDDTYLPSPASKKGSDEKCMTQKCENSDWSSEETNIVNGESGSGGNQYLEVQEASDATAMVAYRFVGRMLDKLAVMEGLELSQGDRLYLRGHSLVPEYSKDPPDKLLTSEFSEMWKDVIEG